MIYRRCSWAADLLSDQIALLSVWIDRKTWRAELPDQKEPERQLANGLGTVVSVRILVV